MAKMDFFQHQENARKGTTRLVVLFLLAVVAIIVAIYLVFFGVLLYARQKQGEPLTDLWNPQLALYVAGGTLLVVALGSLYKIWQLGSGGKVVAQLMGGVPVDPDTRDPLERRLLNVVDEMAIASGTPVPAVYLLPGEGGINAFAAGTQPGDAVVAVTRGTMELLTRDELQGVVAHEFSHILNGDMRLNLKLIGVLHGILLIGIIGYFMLRAGGTGRRSSSSKKGGGQIALIGLGLLVIGYVGVFFGKLIKSAVSRQREFLADASAVQFTRMDWGLAGALKKIGGLSSGARLVTPNAEQASHMFFGEAVGAAWLGALATHPPLEERIRRIQPGWDGAFPQVGAPSAEQLEALVATEARRTSDLAAAVGLTGGAAIRQQRAAQLAREARQIAEAGPTPPTARVQVRDVVTRIGAPQQEHVEYAAQLKARIPEALLAATRTPFSARAVIYALLLNAEAEPRRVQLERLAQDADAGLQLETERLAALVPDLPVEARLPLVDLTIPALRGLTFGQYETFKDDVRHLILADQRIELFEYVIQRILLRHLAPDFEPGGRKDVVDYHAITPLADEIVTVLGLLASVGHDDAAAQTRAVDLAWQRLKLGDRPAPDTGLQALDTALSKLGKSSPQIKKRVLDACVVCIAADGVATVEEAELLRAVADALGCPVPPFLPGQQI